MKKEETVKRKKEIHHRLAVAMSMVICLFAVFPKPAAAVKYQTLGSMAVGSTVKLNVAGVPTDFIVVNQGFADGNYIGFDGGTILLMKNIYTEMQWNTYNDARYEYSNINSYLNNTFKSFLDEDIQSSLKTVKIPYTYGRPDGANNLSLRQGTQGLSTQIFLPSATELGLASNWSRNYDWYDEGTKWSYFPSTICSGQNDIYIAYKNDGTAVNWWLRSANGNPNYYSKELAYYIMSEGMTTCNFVSFDMLGKYDSVTNKYPTVSYGVRPALVLPNTLLITPTGYATASTPPTAPTSISAPDTIYGDTPFLISWAAGTDVDGNLAGYSVERSTDGSPWNQIYQGGALSTTDTVPVGTNSVVYRVKSYDSKGLESDYTTGVNTSVINTANFETYHYQQAVAGDSYILAEQTPSQSTINSIVTADIKTYIGFHENTTHPSRVISGPVAYDGSTVLSRYYDRNTPNIIYSSGTATKNAPILPTTETARYESTVTVAESPTLVGYDFGGWTSNDVDLSNGQTTFSMPDNDVHIVARWTPRTDTHYTVEYYQQNINDDNYTLADTEHCTGTTDTMAVVPEKIYTGFTMTPSSVTASTSTNIDGDGNAVLKLYYDRNVNTVTFTCSGETDETPPAVPVEKTYRYGQMVNIDGDWPTLQGYDFSGWETEDAAVTDGTFAMPDAPVSVTGTWTPRSDTPYTVEYYQQNIGDDNYSKAEADTMYGTGTTGTPITDADKTYPGFTITTASAADLANTKIHSTGDTVLKLYFDRNVYAVAYAYAGETDATPQVLPSSANYRYGQTVTLAAGPSLTGYDFGGWKSADATVTDGSFLMPNASVTLTGTWVPRADTTFVVEYYQQNLEDHDYTKVNTYTGEGITGAPIPQAHKDYDGFTETGPSVAAETATKIASNGSTILKLYYDRNSYTVTYVYSSEHIDGEPACPAEQLYQYGASVTVEPASSELTGYHFDGWDSNDVSLSSGAFTMPAKAVSITGVWAPNTDTPYVVEFFQQNLENDEYSLVSADTVHGHGTTMGAIPEAGKTYQGFSMETASAAEAGTAVVAPDGSTYLKLYYNRNSYTVTYVYAGNVPSNAPALPTTASYKFGETVTLAVSPKQKGNVQFSGWTTSDVSLTHTFSVPGNNVTITGTWLNAFSGDNNQAYTATLISDDTVETKIVENQITLPEGPTKDGYTFVGWSESSGGEAKHQAGDTITLTKSITYYAVYTKKVEAFIYGYRDGTFRPENSLSVYQSQLMLARLTGSTEPDATSNTQDEISRKGFLTMVAQKTDTKLINNDVVATAAEKGWIQGFADGSMREDAYITRAQAVIILNRAFNRPDVQSDDSISYTDVPKGYWAYDQIFAASTT